MSSPKPLRRAHLFVFASLCAGTLLSLRAAAVLPPWLEHIVSGTAIEAALFRAMELPHSTVLFPRPPAESIPALNQLVTASPTDAALLSLRARQQEAALNFTAAERDWKAYAATAPDHLTAELDLADFYHRRLAVHDEFTTLLAIASAPPSSTDAFKAPSAQPSWQAFERALRLAGRQSFAPSTFNDLWRHWLARYPQQPTVYARAFTWELNNNQPGVAETILTQYKAAFPNETIFPIKASALLALRAGGPDAANRALAAYDRAFQPLWPEDLVNSYFDLLAATHNTRRFVATAQASLHQDPADLNAAARLFLYFRHANHPEAAVQVLDTYRNNKEQRDPTGHNWTPQELYTLAQLSASAQAYPDAARYEFALYHLGGQLPDGRSAQQVGLEGLITTLLTAPDQPIALGAANLSMYRDIATLDQGPGFWNGVLSLWLNGQDLDTGFAQEDAKAQPYFHRAKAAVLLKALDQQAPNSALRPSLHAQMINVYAGYGEDTAVLAAGAQFLQTFPHAPERVDIALAMADADARHKDTAAEFAIYDHLLEELGRASANMPLSTAALAPGTAAQRSLTQPVGFDLRDPVPTPGLDTEPTEAETSPSSEPQAKAATAFNLDTGPPTPTPNPAATAYAQVLDRYLGRLTATDQLPQALAVLRKELDRNPSDPKLYERLADFLAQNDLTAQQEELFRAAIAKFNATTWYDKLARLYLREKRSEAFGSLTHQVTDIFSGTELHQYFANVNGGGPQLALQLNLYAHKRFPHDLVFTNNLLRAFHAPATQDLTAWEQLLRQTWWQSPALTNEFFAWLSQTGNLDSELAVLTTSVQPNSAAAPDNPAALEELAQAHIWQSHFEQSAPLFDRLAALYPADQTLGTTDVDLNRSLAWLDTAGRSAHIEQAVAVEQHLLATNPGDPNRLARIGDILADHADGTAASYAPAARFWRSMPATAPGVPDTYLQAATVFWDYFQFDEALTEISAARTHFAQPTLFGYEAGAIFEGKRDLPAAIREYTAAAIAPPVSNHSDTTIALNLGPSATATNSGSDAATDRLLELARRPATSPLVDAATTAALTAHPDLGTLRLRIAVLDAEHRSADAKPLLLTAVAQSTTSDQAAALAAFAQSRTDTAAFEAALQRETELTPDPVEKLQLTYDLVRSYEARNDLAAASQLVEATYRANPRLLGVVRSTVDFDWRSKRAPQASAVLLEAAHTAQPAYAQRFTAEAADKANQSGDTSQARSLALGLLETDPYNPQYLGLGAQSYTAAGDVTGLQQFYRSRLDTIRSAPMTPAQRKQRTALLRRGLIPALTAAKDYAGAVDQYVALLSAYPEDESLVRETALYALRYSQQSKLLAFYAQTTQASSRDARFFIALAQTQLLFGDPSAALTAYTHAVALRPERSDLFIAKAAIEDRQQHFAAAIADYTRLYQLSYKDPRWMVAIAQTQARQGHNADAVRALETAFLHGSQTTPHDIFLVAAQLERWNLLAEAQTSAERGAAAAGPDLLAGDPPAVAPEDAATYARILTRTDHTEQVFATLRSALKSAAVSPSSPSTVAAQVKTSGLASVTDAQWRAHFVKARQERADTGFNAALLAMGNTIATYATPEQRVAFAAALEAQRASDPATELSSRWIPAAHAAGFGALEANWRVNALNASEPHSARALPAFVQLEQSRLRFAELATALDAYIQAHPRSPMRLQTVRDAVEAFGNADQPLAAIRLLRTLRPAEIDSTDLRDRYLDLLLRQDPGALVGVAASNDHGLADAGAETALTSASRTLALAAVHARATHEPPLWSSSYSALAGLYLRDLSPATAEAFNAALQPDLNIGQRLASHPNPQQQATGDLWFYDAARLGDWRLLSPVTAPAADDVLPADLEHAVTPENFLALAQTDSESGRTEPALTELSHALELAPESIDALDAKALLLWKTGRQQQAIATWRSALNSLGSMQNRGSLPESFWIGFNQIAQRTRQYGLLDQLEPDITDVLRTYLAHNGPFRSNELLHAAYDATPNQSIGIDWVLSLSAAAPQPVLVLQDLNAAPWLSSASRETLLQHELDLLQQQAHDTDTTASAQPWLVAQVRTELLQHEIANHHDRRALTLIQNTPSADRKSAVFQQAEIIAHARTGALPALLAHFDSQPETAPEPSMLQAAGMYLQRDGQPAAARTLLEWSFDRSETTHTLTRSQYLDLAALRLKTNDLAAAVDLLHSMVATSEDRDVDEDAAASLLESTAHLAEAIPLLRDLTSGVPWDLSFRVRLAEAQAAGSTEKTSATRTLIDVARNPVTPYTLRVRAARDLAAAHTPQTGLGSAELNLLTDTSISAAAARQPYFADARITAAAQASDLKLRVELLAEAVAIAPYAPNADTTRLHAFTSAAQAAQMAFARAILQVLLQPRSSFGYTSSPAFDQDAGTAQDLFAARDTDIAIPLLPVSAASATSAEKAALSLQIAKVYLATVDTFSGDPSSARTYLTYAQSLLPTGPSRARIAQQIHAIDAAQRLAFANAARRPRIRSALDQSNTVRPRLTVAPEVFNPQRPSEEP